MIRDYVAKDKQWDLKSGLFWISNDQKEGGMLMV